MSIYADYRISGLRLFGACGPLPQIRVNPDEALTQLTFPLAIAGPWRGGFKNPYQSCQQTDVGVNLVVQVLDEDGNPFNCRAATSLLIKVFYPDGTTKDFAGQFLTTGVDGQIVYTTAPGDLSQNGLYYIQAKVLIGGGNVSTRLGQFWVGENADNN